MAKITVRVPHASGREVDAQVKARYGKREVSDAVAIAIAAYYQSPDTVGRVLAALASGATVDSLELADDISRTYASMPAEANYEADRRVLVMLFTWSIDRTISGARDYSTDPQIGRVVGTDDVSSVTATGQDLGSRMAPGGDLYDDENDEDDEGCQGHPAGPYDPMGVTVYCDGTCRP